MAQTRTVTLARLAVILSFGVCGLQYATFASRLVLVRTSLGVSPAVMGLLLLSITAGSVIIMPLTGRLVEHFGEIVIIRTAGALASVAMVGTVTCTVNGWDTVVAIPMLLTGVGIGAWDVSQNLAGTRVEQAMGRAVMPQFHAAYSMATLLGAGIGWLFSHFQAPLLLHVGLIVAISLVILEFSTFWLLPRVGGVASPIEDAPQPAERSAWLEPRTLLIGVVMLSVSLTEGSANDWITSAVVQGFNTEEAMGIACLGMFLAAMTLMRTLGTRLIDRWGRVRTLRLCGVCAIGGLLAFGLGPWLWVSMVGAAIWGLGAALGFPVGISAASDDPLRAARRTSVVSTIGYMAFLGGPPLLGLLAGNVGFREALLVILVPAVVSLLLAGWVAPLKRESAD